MELKNRVVEKKYDGKSWFVPQEQVFYKKYIWSKKKLIYVDMCKSIWPVKIPATFKTLQDALDYIEKSKLETIEIIHEI